MLDGAGSDPGAAVDRPADALPAAPWPPPAEAPLLDAVVAAWRASVFSPRRFFPQLAHTDDLLPSVLYYLVLGVIVAAVGLFWRMVLPLEAGGILEQVLRAGGQSSAVVDVLLAPLWLLLSLFVGAGVVHVMLLILGGAHEGMGTTVRVMCFAYGPALFAVVPVLGTAVGGVWSVVLTILGLQSAHRTTGARAAIAVLIPLFVLVLLAALATILLIAGSAVPL
jgi:hypothetical protein